MRSPFSLVVSFCALSAVYGQQYAGDTIPNTLPAATGAEIAYFNIFDALGQRTTLVNHFSLPGGARQNKALVRLSSVDSSY